MWTRPQFASVLSVLWSGPQAPFLSRYLRAEDKFRDNPRTISAHDAALVILILAAVAVAISVFAAILYSTLIRAIP